MAAPAPRPDAADRDATRGLLLGGLGVLIFAATLPMTRLAVGDAAAPQLPPAFVTAGRAAVAGLLSVLWLLWLRAPLPARRHWPALAQRFIDTKLLGTLTTPQLLEDAVALCLDQGALRRHAERVITRLDAARARTVRLVREAGLRFASPPQGLFGWVDVGVDTDRLAQRLLDEGCLIAPGSLFHARPRPTTLMRVNFAAGQDPRFWRRLRAAASVGK